MNATRQPANDSQEASFDAEVGVRIRQAREALELTQGAVCTRTRMADPLGKGISRTSLVGYESGTSRPGLREIKLLCDVLSITPNQLIYGTDAPIAPSLPAMAMVQTNEPLRDAIRIGFAIAALKGHEREALASLALSLAGRQLGDLRLSGLLTYVGMLGEEIDKLVRQSFPDGEAPGSLEELMDKTSAGIRSNWGTRLTMDPESNPDEARGEWIYPDPKSKN